MSRKAYYSLDSIDLSTLKSIDSLFFEKWLSGQMEKLEMGFSPYQRYYFFDHKELPKLFLFSIIVNTEYGYSLYYHFTFDKENNTLIQVDPIGETGGDGGDSDVDILEYSQNGNVLKRTHVSFREKDGFVQKDSVITQLEFKTKQTK